MKRFVLVLAAASVGAAALVGCTSSSSTSTGAPGTNASASSGGTTPRTDPPRTDPPRTSPPATSRPSGTAINADSAFCTQLRKTDEQSKANSAGGNTTSAAQMEAFITELDALADVAPGDLPDDIRTIAATLEKIAPLTDRPEDMQKLLEIIMAPEVQAASKAVEDAGMTECGIALDITGSGGSSGPTDTPGDATSPGSIKGAGYACSEITPSFDKDESDPTSIYRVKKGMCESGPAGSWGPAVFDHASWSSSGSDPASWEVVVYTDSDPAPSFSGSDAVAVCTTMATYLGSVGSGASEITIATGTSTSSSSAANTELATKSATGSCAAA